MKLRFKYEQIDSVTYRAKVPGGWLIKSEDPTWKPDQSVQVNLIFISDPNHEWEIIETMHPKFHE